MATSQTETAILAGGGASGGCQDLLRKARRA